MGCASSDIAAGSDTRLGSFTGSLRVCEGVWESETAIWPRRLSSLVVVALSLASACSSHRQSQLRLIKGSTTLACRLASSARTRPTRPSPDVNPHCRPHLWPQPALPLLLLQSSHSLRPSSPGPAPTSPTSRIPKRLTLPPRLSLGRPSRRCATSSALSSGASSDTPYVPPSSHWLAATPPPDTALTPRCALAQKYAIVGAGAAALAGTFAGAALPWVGALLVPSVPVAAAMGATTALIKVRLSSSSLCLSLFLLLLPGGLCSGLTRLRAAVHLAASWQPLSSRVALRRGRRPPSRRSARRERERPGVQPLGGACAAVLEHRGVLRPSGDRRRGTRE